MPYKLVKYPDPLLNTISTEITDFGSLDLEGIKNQMIQAMQENNGFGLSAVQVGYPIRMMVMKKAVGPGEEEKAFMAMCNPKVTRTHGTPVKGVEGCLSFPDVFGFVSRHEVVEAEWTEFNGEVKKALFLGMEARCIIHEIDHMDGINFIKRMSDFERFKVQQKLTDLKSGARI